MGDVIILARFPGSRSTSRSYSWDTLGSQEQVAYTVVDTQDSFLSVELLCKISSGDLRHSNFQVDFPVRGTVDKARRYVIPKPTMRAVLGKKAAQSYGGPANKGGGQSDQAGGSHQDKGHRGRSQDRFNRDSRDRSRHRSRERHTSRESHSSRGSQRQGGSQSHRQATQNGTHMSYISDPL